MLGLVLAVIHKFCTASHSIDHVLRLTSGKMRYLAGGYVWGLELKTVKYTMIRSCSAGCNDNLNQGWAQACCPCCFYRADFKCNKTRSHPSLLLYRDCCYNWVTLQRDLTVPAACLGFQAGLPAWPICHGTWGPVSTSAIQGEFSKLC